MSLLRPITGLAVVAVATLGLAAPSAQAAPASHVTGSHAAAKAKAKPKPKPDPLANTRRVAAVKITNNLNAVKRWKTIEATAPRFDSTERVALVTQANAALAAINRDLASVPTAKTAAALTGLVAAADYSAGAVNLGLTTYWVTEGTLADLAAVQADLELLTNQVADLPGGSDPTTVNQAIDDALDAASLTQYKVDMARSVAVGVPGAPTRAQLATAMNGTRSWLGLARETLASAEEKVEEAQEAYLILTNA